MSSFIVRKKFAERTVINCNELLALFRVSFNIIGMSI